jgi:hypothetical protein
MIFVNDRPLLSVLSPAGMSNQGLLSSDNKFPAVRRPLDNVNFLQKRVLLQEYRTK